MCATRSGGSTSRGRADNGKAAWPADKKHGEGVLQGLTNPETFPAWLPDEDIDYLVKEFESSGFRGPLNRYRNFHRDFERAAKYAGKKIEQPALFMAGEMDGGIRMFGQGVEERMRGNFTDLRGFHLIPGRRPLEPAGKAGGDEQAADRLAQRALDVGRKGGRGKGSCCQAAENSSAFGSGDRRKEKGACPRATGPFLFLRRTDVHCVGGLVDSGSGRTGGSAR